VGQATDYASQLVTDLRAANIGKVTDNVRNAVPPCVLVVPVPKRSYEILCGGYNAEWTIVALGAGPGDLSDAKALEDMVDLIADTVGITTAEPASYLLPNREYPAPAYLCTHLTTVTPEE
jgi:hypothetical protein